MSIAYRHRKRARYKRRREIERIPDYQAFMPAANAFRNAYPNSPPPVRGRKAHEPLARIR